jgi:hypothetical protein
MEAAAIVRYVIRDRNVPRMEVMTVASAVTDDTAALEVEGGEIASKVASVEVLSIQLA